MVLAGERFLGWRRQFRAAVVPGEAAYLVSPQGVAAMRGRQIEVLAPLLDGSRTLAGVVREASGELSAGEIGAVIGQLADAELIAFRDEAFPDLPEIQAEEAYWDLAGLDGALARSALAHSPVEVIAVGPVDPAPLREACRESGIVVLESPDGPWRAADAADLTIVLCDDYLAPELAAVDARQREAAKPWLLAKPAGPEPWIGPLFQPGAGPCWFCLTHRLSGHRRTQLLAGRAAGGPVSHPEASIAAARVAATHFAVLETAKWVAGVRHEDQHTVYTLDMLTLRGERHLVTRRPQCPHCGDPGLMAEQTSRPIVLNHRLKASRDGSGHRAQGPERTYARYRHLIGPVTGIVREVTRDPAAPSFLDTFVSGPNLAAGGRTLVGWRSLLREQSGGKGTTEAEARVGALCEAVERYCAVRQGDEQVVLGSYRELAAQAIHPDACQLYDVRQLRDRAAWNARTGPAHRVCEPFDEDERREWTPVWSLTTGGPRLLPTAMLYFHHGGSGSSPQIWSDSNGNAAGSSLEDAIAQGFLELVERDAVALWWYNRTRQPEVDLDAFAEPWVERTVRDYRALGRRVWVLDLTSDLGVPVMAALSARVDGGLARVACGLGAHFDPRVALRRALSEMGQLFAAVLGPAEAADGGAISDPELSAWWGTMGRDVAPFLLPGAFQPRRPESYGYTPRADLSEDVRAAVQLLDGHGLEMLVLDQTRPDIGLPVVKVVVPGLRPMRARFAPGRLFDVPVALGRLTEPTRYDDLNPVPLFL